MPSKRDDYEDSLAQYMNQALAQQMELATTSRKQLQAQALGMRELLDAQAVGVAKAQKEVQAIMRLLPPQVAANPDLRSNLARLSRSHNQVAALQGLLTASVGEMETAQEQVQSQQLAQTQDQVGGVLKMFENQTADLRGTQKKVLELQNFAAQAHVSINQAHALQDVRLQKTQSQVEGLQSQLDATLATQQQLQSELRAEMQRGEHRAEEVDQLQSRLEQSLAAQQRMEAEASEARTRGQQGEFAERSSPKVHSPEARSPEAQPASGGPQSASSREDGRPNTSRPAPSRNEAFAPAEQDSQDSYSNGRRSAPATLDRRFSPPPVRTKAAAELAQHGPGRGLEYTTQRILSLEAELHSLLSGALEAGAELPPDCPERAALGRGSAEAVWDSEEEWV